MENLIKLHKAQLASDRMSCHSATANQVRLVLHTAAFWLMHGVRAAIPRTNPLASSEFATIRDRLIKIGARVIEHIARIRVQLPTSCPEGALFRTANTIFSSSSFGAVPQRTTVPRDPNFTSENCVRLTV
jgi:Transposase DDE domain group 1